ncbi:MAG: 4Fe-4S binding protein [Candidatus Omnitrophota bacterium]|nr:MAG: 4Fe-4S binding protein [Candidatus Omnitrophota bacterium]
MEDCKKGVYQQRRESRRYFINEDVCKACGACFAACPHKAISGEKGKFYQIINTRCRRCGICKKACKHDAIALSTAAIRMLKPQENMENYKKDFYQKLRSNISKWANSKKGKKYKWAQYLLIAPDLFHALCRSVLDKDVPLYEKTKLSLVIAYFISPLDLISEMIMGPVGYIDDVALAAYALNILLNNIDPQIIARYWAGDEALLKTIRRILADAEMMVTSGMWRKIKKAFR